MGKHALFIPTLAFIGLLLFVFAAPANAFRVSFEVEPKALRIGEAASMTVTVQGLDNPPPPDVPEISGLRISGPGVERSFSYITRNGVTEQSSSVTFRYRIIPLEPGDFEIGPFTYAAQGQSVELPARELRVVMPGADLDEEAVVEKEETALPDLLFAELHLSRSPVYVQEVFDITISIYSRGLNLGRDIFLENMPETGLSVRPFQELRTTREIVDNDVYDVRRYRARARALRSGAIVFEPILRLHVLAERRTGERRGPFDDWFGLQRNVERHAFDLKPDRVELSVKPLPVEGRPDAFTGAVGQFNFQAEVDPQEITQGDPLTVRMRVAGEGNIDAVIPPGMEAQEGFRTYDVRVTSRNLNQDLTSGEKIFEQIVIPQSADISELPPLRFAYFDPVSESYKSITRGPYPLQVRPADPHAPRVAYGDPDPERARLLGTDIAYIRPPPDAWRHVSERPWYRHPAFWGSQVIPPLALISLLWISRRKREFDRDPAKARRQRAPRSARAGLRQAESARQDRNRADFYEALWQATASYFGNRLNLPPGDIEASMVLEALRRGGLDAEDHRALQALFDACERERFGRTGAAPVAVTDDEVERWSALLNTLSRLLKKCERIRI